MIAKIGKVLKTEKIYFWLVAISILFPLILSVKIVLDEGMAFWFDPARDFLLAAANLNKPTLIGQPTGIPGIFYGPFWIWLISLGLRISRDPKIVTLLILTIPYGLIFPYILSKFKRVYGKYIWIILWLLFYYSFAEYGRSPWNPHLAPLLFLLIIYLLVELKIIFIAGLVSGLLLNFHFSFGLASILGTFLFLLFLSIKEVIHRLPKWKKEIPKHLFRLFIYLAGLLTTLIPFFAFEFRHGGNQIKAFSKTFTDAFFYNTAAVGVVGLTRAQIISQFFLRFFKLLNIPFPEKYLLPVSLATIIFLLILFIKKKIRLDKIELKMTIFLLFISSTLLFIYLSSKNPVWEYHFIGFEIIFLLLIGIIIKKIKLLKNLLIIWVAYLTLLNLYSLLFPHKINPYSISSLKTKKYIVDKIYQDAQKRPFTVLIYSPSIYTYDYDYIFSWYGKDKYSYTPDKESITERPIYLIIPKTTVAIKEDFINYKTPLKNFKTEREWSIEDGTTIIKRSRLD